jgi:hypothetical protein
MPYIILGVLLHHAPDASAQAKTVEVYHQQYLNVIAVHEVNQSLEYEKVLVGILHAGLFHGKWPWNRPEEKVTDEEMLAGIHEVFATRDPGTFVPLSEINVGRIYGGRLMAYVTSARFDEVTEYSFQIHRGVHGLTKNYIATPTKDPEPTKTGTWGPWGEGGRQGK